MIRKYFYVVILFLSLSIIHVSSANEISPHIFSTNREDSLSTCKDLEILLSSTPGLLQSVYKGEFHEDNTNKNIKGCMIAVSGSVKALGKNQSPTDKLYIDLTNRGWNPLNQYAADGPDGTFYVLSRNNRWVIVRGSWDGGDDSDPNYIPDDNYQIIIILGKIVVK